MLWDKKKINVQDTSKLTAHVLTIGKYWYKKRCQNNIFSQYYIEFTSLIASL